MKQLDLYTDGSHFKRGSGRLGIGGVLVDLTQQGPLGTKLGEFSVELRPEELKREFGPGAEHCSNPTAELIAVLVSLRNFIDLIKTADIVNVHADYIGVREWMTGRWKTNEPYIAKLKAIITDLIKKEGLIGKIKYAWVKGHQKQSLTNPDIYWNNYVDLLAKGENNEKL